MKWLVNALKRFEEPIDVTIRCEKAKFHMSLNVRNQIIEKVLGNYEGYRTDFVRVEKPFHFRYTSETLKHKIDLHAEDI